MAFITSKQVTIGYEAASREDALHYLAEQGVALGFAEDVEAVYQAFLEREAIAETGLQDGFAVPHAKTDAIKGLVMDNVITTQNPSSMLKMHENVVVVIDQELADASGALQTIPYEDREGWLTAWQNYIKVWNEKLPDIPLYSDEYHDFFSTKVKGWDATSIWEWSRAVLDAWVEE